MVFDQSGVIALQIKRLHHPVPLAIFIHFNESSKISSAKIFASCQFSLVLCVAQSHLWLLSQARSQVPSLAAYISPISFPFLSYLHIPLHPGTQKYEPSNASPPPPPASSSIFSTRSPFLFTLYNVHNSSFPQSLLSTGFCHRKSFPIPGAG